MPFIPGENRYVGVSPREWENECKEALPTHNPWNELSTKTGHSDVHTSITGVSSGLLDERNTIRFSVSMQPTTVRTSSTLSNAKG